MANLIDATINLPGERGKYWPAIEFNRQFPVFIVQALLGVWLCLLLCCMNVWAQTPPAGTDAPKAQTSRAYNPVVPYDALIAGRPGWAEISFTVDNNGRATFLSTIGASEPAFASALQADIEAIEFIPPRVNGRALMSTLKERFDFPGQPTLDVVARGVLAELKKPKPAIYSVEELDKKPEPIRQPPPAYPWVLRSDGASGQAEIEFVIDRNGRPLFPHIVSATNGDFGWAAATGIQRWRYQPPVKKGAKVDALMKVTVTFDIDKAADMW